MYRWSRVEESVFHRLHPHLGATEDPSLTPSPVIALLSAVSRVLGGSARATWLVGAFLCVACDTVAALSLGFVARRAVSRPALVGGHGSAEPVRSGAGGSDPGAIACAVYLFNPFGVATCAAMSLSAVEHALVAASIACAASGSAAPSALLLSGAAHLGIYPGLLAPALALIAQVASRGATARTRGLSPSSSSPSSLANGKAGAIAPGRYSLESGDELVSVRSVLSLAAYLLWFAVGFCALLGAAYAADGSSLVPLGSVYDVIVRVTELSPNSGIMWYFSIEVFDDFRPLFMIVLQAQVFFYPLPLRARLRGDPLFCLCATWLAVCAFRSYPSFSDLGILAALLLSSLTHITERMRFGFLSCNFVLYATVLRPVFLDQWIVRGAGNANFYWAACVAHSFAQTWLLTDLLFAHFDLRHDSRLSLTSRPGGDGKGNNKEKKDQ